MYLYAYIYNDPQITLSPQQQAQQAARRAAAPAGGGASGEVIESRMIVEEQDWAYQVLISPPRRVL